MNAPYELMQLSGVWPGAKDTNGIVVFVGSSAAKLSAELAVWKAAHGISPDCGHQFLVRRILAKDAKGMRALVWTRQADFASQLPEEPRLARWHRAPKQLLLVDGHQRLAAWMAAHKYADPYSVHSNLLTPNGERILGAYLLVLRKNG